MHDRQPNAERLCFCSVWPCCFLFLLLLSLWTCGVDRATASRIVKAVEWQMAKENLKLDAGEIKVFADRETEGAWRVEFFDDDGGCYVTVFSGPHAEKRARAYGWALAEGTVQPIPN
jgi:hypothetical protein